MVKVFIPNETQSAAGATDAETRVAATPETVKKMVAAGLEVAVEHGAGGGSHIADDDYQAAGAQLVSEAILTEADVVLRVNGPDADAAGRMKEGALLIALLSPLGHLDVVSRLSAGRVSSLAMELVPRISRAQDMDALSSQASIAGYKAVLLAAYRLGKYFPLLMTAAGTIRPARVVVMGAGVAGLQAVATAKRLGAVVEVSDIRPVVKEQVESLGGKFIELPEQEESGEGKGGYAKQMSEDFLRRQREIVTRHVANANVVICTALVPGRKAPTLLTQEMVEGMKSGSLIVDLAVAQGGNCVLSKVDEDVVHQGVTILGPSNLPAETPTDASSLYARNVWALLKLTLGEGGSLNLDLEDEIIDGALLTHGGEIRNGAVKDAVEKEGGAK